MNASLVALLALLAQDGRENRLWRAEVQLGGALEEVRFDCREDGETRIRTDLAAGEDRKVLVPLPIRCPSGSEGLDAIPSPAVHARGSGGATVLRFAAGQPADGVARLPIELRSRSRPPLVRGSPRAGLAELALVAAAFLLTHSRRRMQLVLGSVAAALLVFFLANRRVTEVRETRVLELDLEARTGLLIRGAWDALVLPADRLEVDPAHARVELELELEGGDELQGWICSRGSRLYALELSSVEPSWTQPWSRARNDHADFSRTWIRTAEGRWSAAGPWRRGEPLSAGSSSGEDPPGWLCVGLPLGRSVFLGEVEEGAWVRATGFPD